MLISEDEIIVKKPPYQLDCHGPTVWVRDRHLLSLRVRFSPQPPSPVFKYLSSHSLALFLQWVIVKLFKADHRHLQWQKPSRPTTLTISSLKSKATEVKSALPCVALAQMRLICILTMLHDSRRFVFRRWFLGMDWGRRAFIIDPISAPAFAAPNSMWF